jgi:hypothetical protein
LRGREAVARWRLRAGLWAAWLSATACAINAVLAVIGPGGPQWRVAISFAGWAAGLIIAAPRIESGSRGDAVALFAVFLVGDLVRWLTGHGSFWSGVLSVLVLLALGNAVWGTFALARIEHEKAEIPPVPSRAT